MAAQGERLFIRNYEAKIIKNGADSQNFVFVKNSKKL